MHDRRDHYRKAALFFAAFFLLVQLVLAGDALARAGGGGSSSGGSSGGSSSSSSSSSSDRDRSYSSVKSTPLTGFQMAVGLVLGAIVVAAALIAMKRGAALAKKEKEERAIKLAAAVARDPSWDPKALEARAREVFMAFQKAWGEFDVQTMSSLLTENYYKRMVLELNVLGNMKRRNRMDDVRLVTCEIGAFYDSEDDGQDWFEAKMFAGAVDNIIDESAGVTLFTDRTAFTEYWRFRREAGMWKLDIIKQSTEAVRFSENAISSFANANGFYYDPDFGWLMMPDKGALFGKYGFGKADINNHVIGYYRNKIVEFYTYRPTTEKNAPNYLVAQAILPRSYHDIWVKKRSFMASCPSGLREMSLEYGDFNKKFLVCAHPEDQVSSLELLQPNFMTKIYDLPFELNIELVSNVLYFYTKQRDVSYDQMLQILAWAFDEMKM